MSVAVDPDRIEDAADEFALAVAPAVDAALSTLSTGLCGSSSMAGDDIAGNAWSTAYDDAAHTVMGVGTDVTNGSYKIAGLLEMTWGNHARAEADSHAGGASTSDYPRTLNYADNQVCSYDVPLSYGGVAGEPAGWKLISSAVGFAWPGGHQDRLRTAARAWGAAGTSLHSASTLVPPAVSALQEQKSPEIASAVTVTRAMQGHITDLADACADLHHACEDYAGFLDTAHRDAGHELHSLITWTIGIETGGALLSVASAGLAEVAAQGAEAARIALTAARVAGIIRDLITAAQAVCATIARTVTRVIEISRKLKVLLGARLTRATARAVSKLPNEATTTEELAESRLTADAGKLKAALDRALRPERIDHVFFNKRHTHHLEALIEAAGGPNAAMEEIIRSIGDISDGVYGEGAEVIRVIRGIRVKIRGAMIDGVFKISTAFLAK